MMMTLPCEGNIIVVVVVVLLCCQVCEDEGEGEDGGT